jgi:hypothetical protein
MENRRSVYESYWTEVGMVPAFHSEAVSHGKNIQVTNSQVGTVLLLSAKSGKSIAATNNRNSF